jgi:hypothetical protein
MGEKGLKNQIILTTTLLLASIIIPVTLAQTAQAAFESQTKDFGQGREDGVAAGAAGYQSGMPRSGGACPAGHSTSYCIGYASGWVRGWDDAKDLGR